MVFFDALRVKIREDAVVRNKAVYLALGVLPDGTRDILGQWIENTEGAKFWLKVFNDLKTRGVADIMIAVTDGLKGSHIASMRIIEAARSRIQAAHSAAAPAGQVTVTVVGPRRSSTRMSGAWAGGVGAGKLTGTKTVFGSCALAASPASARTTSWLGRISASSTQRRSRLALMPWAIATAAVDMPGCAQAASFCFSVYLVTSNPRVCPGFGGQIRIEVDTRLLCPGQAFNIGGLDAHEEVEIHG